MVQAAVVTTWGTHPTYQSLTLPPPTPTQHRIRILAAGLHTLVRSRAAGRHYTTEDASPPHVPGTDGVGTIIPTGELVYFNALSSPTGSFAEEINIDKQDVFPLPHGADADAIALLANAVMSCWMALTARAGIMPEQRGRFSVAVLGATGVSGQAAVRVARALGAERVVAIGKAGAKLESTLELGATAVIELDELGCKGVDFGEAADVDVVLDYLWGNVVKVVLPRIIADRKDKSQRLTWVEIGAMGGDEFTVSAALLRRAGVAFLGCGPGSWTYDELRAQLPSMLRAMVEGRFTAEYKVERLAEVEKWWKEFGEPRKLVKP